MIVEYLPRKYATTFRDCWMSPKKVCHYIPWLLNVLQESMPLLSWQSGKGGSTSSSSSEFSTTAHVYWNPVQLVNEGKKPFKLEHERRKKSIHLGQFKETNRVIKKHIKEQSKGKYRGHVACEQKGFKREGESVRGRESGWEKESGKGETTMDFTACTAK